MKSLTVVSQDQEFTFYDNSDDTILRQFSGFEFSDIRPQLVELIDRATYITAKHDKRRLSWQGDLLGDVFDKRRDMLSVMRQTGDLKLLKFVTYDDLELQVEAEIIKVVNPYNHKVHSFMVEAVSPDWRFYSQDLHTDELSANSVDDVVNSGNEWTSPVYKITGPGTDFSVQNNLTDDSFLVEYTLGAGEYIEVDVYERSVKLNGITNIYRYFSGDFARLKAGTNEYSFMVASGNTGDTKLEVIYRDAYRGV